mgnify:CR=1 FL=1
MNYKLEKFWNRFTNAELMNAVVWTINLKSFEIKIERDTVAKELTWTINLKSFEIL